MLRRMSAGGGDRRPARARPLAWVRPTSAHRPVWAGKALAMTRKARETNAQGRGPADGAADHDPAKSGKPTRSVVVTRYEIRDLDGTLQAVHQRNDIRITSADGAGKHKKNFFWFGPDGCTVGLNG